MSNVNGTNLVPADASKVEMGQITVGETSVRLSTETSNTGPLSHGVWFTTAVSTFYINAGGATTAVTVENGVMCKANNPLFIPIKDPSQINLIASGADKLMTFVMS